MTESGNFPHVVKPKPFEEFSGDGTGCGYGILMFVAALIVMAIFQSSTEDVAIPNGVAYFWIPLLVSIGSGIYGSVAQRQRAADEEARSVTSTLVVIHDDSLARVADLPQNLVKASSLLVRAEQEFNATAYSPFWDAIEEAAKHLGSFDGNIRVLSQNASRYHYTLKSRQHTFPALPVNPNELPSTDLVLRRLFELVRRGQTNFEFAVIWEHRKTREVLIAGFRTLAEAIDGLSYTVESSLTELRKELSSGNSMLADRLSDLRKANEQQVVILDELKQGHKRS